MLVTLTKTSMQHNYNSIKRTAIADSSREWFCVSWKLFYEGNI